MDTVIKRISEIEQSAVAVMDDAFLHKLHGEAHNFFPVFLA